MPLSEKNERPSMIELYDWKKARMRSESNILLGILLLITVLLAKPIANVANSLMSSNTALIIIGVLGLAIYIAVVQWRNQGVFTVYGLNMLGTVLIVVAALGLFAPEQTTEMLQSIPSQRVPLAVLAALLLAMGFGLRGNYLKREQAQAEMEAEKAAAEQAAAEGAETTDAESSEPD